MDIIKKIDPESTAISLASAFAIWMFLQGARDTWEGLVKRVEQTERVSEGVWTCHDMELFIAQLHDLNQQLVLPRFTKVCPR